ncbi:transposable element Tcb2 transposase [Trichonephila clavipes]|nr:transposable element Tcb2 transposase [Trichonephila clavipes]
MARIVRDKDESVREGYIRNGGKEVKLFTSALNAFQCNNRIVMAQRNDPAGSIRGTWNRPECHLQALATIPRLCYRYDSFKEDHVQRRLGHIGLYARKPVRCVSLTATDYRLRSREYALWTSQQWSCVMFFDESRFSWLSLAGL